MSRLWSALSATSGQPGPVAPALRFALAALAYWLAAQASLLAAPVPGFERVVWLPSGLALAGLLAWGPRLWPAIALGGFVLGASLGMGVFASLTLAGAGAIEALIAASVLLRLGFDARFMRLRGALAFTAVAFGVALFGGTLEFSVLLPGIGAGDRQTMWWVCWLGHALGMLLVVPLALGLPESGQRERRGARSIELLALAAATGGLTLAVFTSMGDPHMFNPMSYALFPLLLWGVLRFGPREVSALLLMTAFVAAWGTAGGNGPFALSAREASLGSLYLYLSVAGIGALALSASIAERTGVAGALAASERQYRELVETMNEGVIALDTRGRVRFVSKAFGRMAGAAPDALIGRPAVALLGEGARAWGAGIDSAKDALPSFETLLMGDGATKLEVSVSPRAMRDDAGRVTGWLAVVADISERRRTDDMLRWIARATAPLTGEAFFRELMRHMASAFGFKYAFITECVSYPATRLRTLACWKEMDFTPNREYDLAGTPCEETIRGRRAYCVRDGIGDRYPADQGLGVQGYLGVPITDSAGDRIIGHVAFLSESPMDEAVLASPLFQILTSRAGAELRRKHAEEQGRQHLQQLAQVSRALALGEMGSAIAHELNQPLAAIANYAHASRRRMKSGEGMSEVTSALERIAAQAERAGEILRRLRGFLTGGGATPSVADLDVLVAEILDLAQPEARQRGVELRMQLARDLALVRVDAIQVQQVVLNLVRNAVEASAAANGERREVTLATGASQGGVEIAVTDTGPGVPEELSERIFEPFFTTKTDGTGIGLTISRSIAQAHGGRLRIERPRDGGARFVLWLPCAEDTNA